MRLKNTIRTILKIRAERELPPPGEKPQVGSNIVLDRLRIRLKYPITDEQWKWFTNRGWRTVDMRTDRRRYTLVPDKGLTRLLAAEGLEREVLHRKLVNLMSEEARAQRRADRLAKNSEIALMRNSSIGA
ncbi:MAG TPA: hypothetical protein VIF60_02280 [Burkholderiaceae bacterium]|jgi:hypothetical protein